VLVGDVAPAVSTFASVFFACDAISSAAATSTSFKKPAATAMLMSLVTRSSKATATNEDRELATLEKMEHGAA
jgi:hypothetical protein